MKKFIIMMLMVAAFLPGQSQTKNLHSPLLDATALKADIDTIQMTSTTAADKGRMGDSIVATINCYLTDRKATSYSSLLALIADDSVLVHALPAAVKLPSPEANHSLPDLGTVRPAQKGGYEGFQLPSATTAVDGLATFIADRFKQELEMAYIDKFKKTLTDNKALATLLPNTVRVLTQNDPFQYTTFLESLKESLQKDLKALPADFGDLMRQDPLNWGTPTNAYYPLVLLYNNIVQILNRHNPTQVLSTLDQDSLMQKIQSPIGSIFRLTAIVSRNLVNPVVPNNTAWSKLTNIDSVVVDAQKLNLFVGILLIREKKEMHDSMKLGNSNFYDVINRHWSDITPIGQWIVNIATTHQSIQTDFESLIALRGIKKDSISVELIENFSKDLTSLISLAANCPFVNDSAYLAQHPVVNGILSSMSIWVQIPSEIASKNYGLALTDVLEVMTAVAPNSKTVAEVVKYGNFAVSISKATSASDFDQALESAALPVGSYAVKRHSYENISLNAYAGVFGAVQQYPGAIPASVIRQNTLLGFTAPVGIAYSWGNRYESGHKRDSLNGSSSTIFLSVIDIGSVTAFRLTHDSTATLPSFTWANVLAPGLFYIYGFAKSPVSIGGGVQYGPQLRSVTNNSAEVLPSAISYRLFVVVDIPLFNLFTRTELK